jgi:enoyl-CoA hydratase/carnithine racemase
VRGTKTQVQAIFEGITDAHREKLRVMGIATFDSEDYREGTRAFMEKRAARFQGR